MSVTSLPIASYSQAWRELRGHLGRRRGLLAAALLVSLAASACAMVAPLAIGALIDALTFKPSADAVVQAVAVMVAGVLAGAALTWWARVLFARVAEPAVGALRESVVDRALRLEPADVGGGGGDLVSRVSDDSRIVASAVSQLIPTVVGAATLLLLSVPTLFTLHWVLGLVVLVAVPLYWLSLRWYLPRSEPLYALERERLGRRTSRLLGAVHGERTLRAHGWLGAENARIERASAQSRDAGNTVFTMLTGFFARNNRAEFVVMALLLVAGYFLVSTGTGTVGAVTAAALLFHRLFDPLSAIVVLFDVVQEAGISLRRLTGVLTIPLASRPAPARHAEASVAAEALSVKVLRHSYGHAAPVLDDVSLGLRAGESVALVGTSGAGKSTLAGIASGTLSPSEGSARVDGTDMAALPAAALRSAVVLVSQRTHVFDGSLRQNLCLGVPLQRRTAARMDDAIARAGATWVGALPEGLDTHVGAGGRRLSTVQEQQLALARVLLIDPAFVVLDEATAEAGSSGARALDDAALEVMRGRGALVVAHRLSQASLADRIVVMERGRIVEEGPHAQLVGAGGPYSELWRAWAGDENPR